jgi:hypothetical protein
VVGFRFLLLISCFFLFTGCVSSYEGAYQWKKEGAKPDEYTIVNAQCKSEAYKAVPIPSVNLSGCEFMSAGFSQGFCSGASARQNRERRDIRNEIYEGCMMSNGWKKGL